MNAVTLSCLGLNVTHSDSVKHVNVCPSVKPLLWSYSHNLSYSIAFSDGEKVCIPFFCDRIKVEEMFYLYSENKGADQLCSYCTADLRRCFRIGKIWLSHYMAHISWNKTI